MDYNIQSSIQSSIQTDEQTRLRETLILADRNLSEKRRSIVRLNELDLDDYVYNNLVRQYATRIKSLESALLSPYFARIDFTEEGRDAANRYYIGKITIFDNENIAVVDWRAPISSVYYEGGLGKVSYISPGGIARGELGLKRQYRIENGELLHFQDIDISTNDQFLQDFLSVNSDVRLKNIVSTIQSEQNRIIRADMDKPLIVQGVAGSGKTTVALHRIAYLAYTHENRIKPEEFLILAPNKFLLDYVSGVLPDLGVDFVRQETIEDFACSILSGKMTLENTNAKFTGGSGGGNVARGGGDTRSGGYTRGAGKSRGADKARNMGGGARSQGGVSGADDPDLAAAVKVAKFKTGMEFKAAIDTYLDRFNASVLQNMDFAAGRYVLIKHAQLQNTFMDHAQRLSVAERIGRLKLYLQKWMENNAESLTSRISSEAKRAIDNIPKQFNEAKASARKSKIQEDADAIIKELRRGGKKIISDYIKNFKLLSVWDHYKAIISDDALLAPYLDRESVTYARASLSRHSKRKTMEHEDIPALLYIQLKIFGLDEKFSLKHIIVDEAQDFGLFQFLALRDILGCQSMTILGDLAQGIYAHRGLDSWESLNDAIYNGNAGIEHMRVSYRTTIEIMEEANKALSKLHKKLNTGLALPAIRHGEAVSYYRAKDEGDSLMYILDRLSRLRDKGYKNIALISRSESESHSAYELLSLNNIDACLLTEASPAYEGGLTVMPAYLSKGLEFDAVLLIDADSANYRDNDLDAKLLYVAMTRAMHSLDIVYEGTLTELLCS